jgi:K(+)-stimulated pyrophosphate-energized sodium pump
VRGIGVLSSIIGTYLVRGGPGKGGDAMAAIFRGFLSSAAISAVLFFIAGYFYLQGLADFGGWWRTPTAVAVGVLLAILIDRLTEYFTGTHASPVDIRRLRTLPATLFSRACRWV